MKRRKFLQGSGGLCFFGCLNILPLSCISTNTKRIRIIDVASAVEKEPLIRPFGFKGGYLTELWQSVVQLTSANGTKAVGLGTQSVLWSDSSVFSANSETEGNSLMFSITKKALEIINGQSFIDPISLIENIMEEVYEYGKKITGNPDLRKTFILNALVPVDNALWILYAKELGISNFDEMIPSLYRAALSNPQRKLSVIPLIAYNTPIKDIRNNARDGSFFLKIKIGQSGTQQEMLEKDKARLYEIHSTIGAVKTPYTKIGKVLYYLDANGRYENKQTLVQFIKYAKLIGAFEQIALIEEPFPEEAGIDVSDLGVVIASDESAHTDLDVMTRIQMGYKAIALKPIAKTLSMTLKILKVAYEHDIPCFCADLTVNPILVEWNKNIAARLSPLPNIKVGLLETNGDQNYKNWDKLCSYNPANGSSWTKASQNIFELDEGFYRNSGGIFMESDHYKNLFGP